MTKAKLGVKRTCPETGRKFYDLEKDPIVSPYTDKEYPLSFFQNDATVATPVPKKSETKPSKDPKATESADDDDLEIEDIEADTPEIISLEDAESDDIDDEDNDDDIPDIPDVELDEDDKAADSDTFLEEDEDSDDLSDVIVTHDDKEEDL